jgi:hypothetical protein
VLRKSSKYKSSIHKREALPKEYFKDVKAKLQQG